MLKSFSILGLIIFVTSAIIIKLQKLQVRNTDYQFEQIADLRKMKGTDQPKTQSLEPSETLTSNKITNQQFDDSITLMNKLQEEIANFSDRYIENQIAILKTNISNSDLIDRLNKDNIDASERKNAQVILARLAILGVEKAKRNLDHLIPEMEVSLAKHQENLANIRRIITD